MKTIILYLALVVVKSCLLSGYESGDCVTATSVQN